MRLSNLFTLAALALASCISTESAVSVSTDPPGAVILVNGQDSGLSTPVVMSLDRDDHRIDLELPGYHTATRFLVPGSGREAVLWREMSIDPKVWNFPLWLTLQDVAHSATLRFPLESSRIFVRLQPSGD